tara:strand:- start:760 stop:1317 length:558 start_codon:yes stop_codon:yes gene_type:complete
MKIFKTIFITFIFLTCTVKADLDQNFIKEFEQGGKLIFIRHAYAPGSGDPKNFNLNDCSTQRNLNDSGREQSKNIGNLFSRYNVKIDNVYTSEWCRCKETASIAFEKFETKKFLNSFYSTQFAKNRKKQIKDFKDFLEKWNKKDNFIFVTHYVVISEILNYPPSSGEVIIVDKNLNIVDTLEIEY